MRGLNPRRIDRQGEYDQGKASGRQVFEDHRSTPRWFLMKRRQSRRRIELKRITDAGYHLQSNTNPSPIAKFCRQPQNADRI
jgi:hypothetical protein